jgi:hypothetical protein
MSQNDRQNGIRTLVTLTVQLQRVANVSNSNRARSHARSHDHATDRQLLVSAGPETRQNRNNRMSTRG